MKGRLKIPMLKTLSICTLVFAGLALPSKASTWTLTDLNSSASVNDANPSGMFNWTVDGVNNMSQQWFWYRVGSSGPESSIDTISAAATTHPQLNTLFTLYQNNTFSIEVDYTLTGSTVGSGQSTIGESIKIHNFTASPLDFHFFQYSDYDLGGTTGGDTVGLSKSPSGLFNGAEQTKGNVAISENSVTPGANHGEAAFFNTTLAKLNNATADTLNDNAGPVGPGDVTWAFEWDKSIAAGGDLIISKNKQILPVVPEPGTLALISLGLAALVLRRRAFPN